jgi:hypothetical protein
MIKAEQEVELCAIEKQLERYRALTSGDWQHANIDAYWDLCSRRAKLLRLLSEYGPPSAA